MSTNRKAKTNVVQLNPALKGYTLDKRHPLSGYVADDPECLAIHMMEQLDKVAVLVQSIIRLSPDPQVGGIAKIGLSLLEDLHNTMDCERECHRDAKLAASA